MAVAHYQFEAIHPFTDGNGRTGRVLNLLFLVEKDLLDRTAATIRREAPKVYSRELAELIFAQPYCRISNLVEAKIAQRQSVSVYLKKLVAIGVLEERKIGREKLFINPDFPEILTRTQPW